MLLPWQQPLDYNRPPDFSATAVSSIGGTFSNTKWQWGPGGLRQGGGRSSVLLHCAPIPSLELPDENGDAGGTAAGVVAALPRDTEEAAADTDGAGRAWEAGDRTACGSLTAGFLLPQLH